MTTGRDHRPITCLAWQARSRTGPATMVSAAQGPLRAEPGVPHLVVSAVRQQQNRPREAGPGMLQCVRDGLSCTAGGHGDRCRRWTCSKAWCLPVEPTSSSRLILPVHVGIEVRVKLYAGTRGAVFGARWHSSMIP